jgi:hypothetical protein
MAFKPELDDLSTFEAKETSRKIPVGFSLLYFGLILFGVYYLWAYTPALGGWRQAMDAEGGGASPEANTFMTILFTALASAVAMGLALAQRRKARKP